MDNVVEFAHERLQAYRVAREFVGTVGDLLAGLPRGESALADQLRRASDSVLLNLAEGAGRRAGRDKARYFVIARGSGTECAAILDILRLRRCAGRGRPRGAAGATPSVTPLSPCLRATRRRGARNFPDIGQPDSLASPSPPCRIRARRAILAQWQSSGFVNRRSPVQIRGMAPARTSRPGPRSGCRSR